MAQAMASGSQCDLTYLTDCMYFISGYCNLNDTCRYRHCRGATIQLKNCPEWPKTCRNVTCLYRHPAIQQSSPQTKSLVSFFWDIENVPIPKGQKPFDIVQRIRQKLVIEPGLQEADFSCYCKSDMISDANQISLHHANVRIVHVPDRKPGAADRQIMLDLARFERVHRPPATAVLISGDIDFVGILSGLRHQAGFRVIVIHNKPAKEELKATVHEHYPWELFAIQQKEQPINAASGLNSTGQERQPRTAQPNRMRHSSRNRSLRRRDPSNNQLSMTNNQVITRYPCPKCTNEFESIQGLRQHQNAKNHLFNCPVCNESFVTAIGQTQHQKDKNHYVLANKCNQCNRYFSKIESLNQHQQATGHISSDIQSSDQNGLIHRQSSSLLLPASDHGRNHDDEDSILIILQGIEAIKQFYTKRFQRNN